MALVVFDIDGTLTRSTGVDDECFVRAMRDEVGLSGFDCDWANYPHATDSGLTQEIVRRHAGREATAGEQARVQRRMVELLRQVADREPERFGMVAGATALMRRLSEKRGWAVSIATGAW
ncbi:MAG: HAD family hydrolase, partial [Planctomyces sp.]